MYIVTTKDFTYQTKDLDKAMIHLNFFKDQGIKVKLYLADDII